MILVQAAFKKYVINENKINWLVMITDLTKQVFVENVECDTVSNFKYKYLAKTESKNKFLRSYKNTFI